MPMSNDYYKCAVCGGQIDKSLADIIAVKSGRRYIHNDCYEHKDEIEQQLNDIHEYCQTHMDNYNKKLVSSQIGKYINDYTPQEMLQILKYFFSVKNNANSGGNGGIGIIPYVADEALNYYKNKEMIQKMMEAPPVVEIHDKYRRPQPPRGKMVKPRNRRWIDLD
jgi:hypothetical protein